MYSDEDYSPAHVQWNGTGLDYSTQTEANKHQRSHKNDVKHFICCLSSFAA